jgi:short-subunit dehydrogenase involved in D-alanine esterification of teichoic acids
MNVTTGYVYIPSARTAAYSATKTALHVMTLALRYQLRDTPVRVVEVMPPPVATAMSSHYNGSKTTPEKVATTILRGLWSGRNEVVIGIFMVPKLFARIAPGLGFRLV